MRVLHLINALNKGGIEKWLISMLEEIPRDLCEMDVLCKGTDTGPWTETVEMLGATVYHFPLRPSHIGFVRGLSNTLRTGGYDLVHNHLHAYGGCATWVARKAGIPVFTTLHSTWFGPENAWLSIPVLRHLRRVYATVSMRYSLRESDLVGCVSQAIIDYLKPENLGIAHKFRIMPHGVDVPEQPTDAERTAFRSEFGWPPHTPIVCHVGRFFPQKNHAMVIEVFSRVLPHVPNARLLLIGDGPLKSNIASMIESRGMDESVLLVGLRDDVPSLLTKCDLFLFPSLVEGFGLAPLEGTAAGLPVVATRIPGLQEAVEDGITAILHDVDDVNGMANSVVKLITDPAYSTRIGEAGRIWVQKHFSRAAAAERLLTLYHECLGTSEMSLELPQ